MQKWEDLKLACQLERACYTVGSMQSLGNNITSPVMTRMPCHGLPRDLDGHHTVPHHRQGAYLHCAPPHGACSQAYPTSLELNQSSCFSAKRTVPCKKSYMYMLHISHAAIVINEREVRTLHESREFSI